jgi:transcriptional regulator with XRE-family HTH domain
MAIMLNKVDRMIVAERLRLAREQSGLSQGQVATKMGFQRPTITEIEAGRRRVTAEEVSTFAEIYDVSVSWLLAGSPDIPDPAVELAARELAKLKKEDVDTILSLLRSLRRREPKP